MEKFLVPGAIIVASIIVATTFRVEMRPLLGMSGESYLMQDRWTGVVSRCGTYARGCVALR
ncbi:MULTISPECIES: hypothetical protein [unclassified Mesorhizobium]|uniref:hypothetical protein n=1 Tax=unclassified Mesorhizobium TaxID=325217 RepID=UPI00333C07C4